MKELRPLLAVLIFSVAVLADSMIVVSPAPLKLQNDPKSKTITVIPKGTSVDLLDTKVNFVNELGPLSRVRYRSVIGFTYPNLLSKTGKRETAIRWKINEENALKYAHEYSKKNSKSSKVEEASPTFVSRVLIAGGHPQLNDGVCRGKAFNGAEPSSGRLYDCLIKQYGWISSGCSKFCTPPSDVAVGDVVVFRGNSCSGEIAQFAIVNRVSNGIPFIASKSKSFYDRKYTYNFASYPYCEFLVRKL